MTPKPKHDFEKAAAIVRDAGGEVVGRTRLQKVACVLELTGLGDGFQFSYKHFGPYCKALTTASHDAYVLGFLTETEQSTSWGGWYSIFRTELEPDPSVSPARRALACNAAKANSIELELAVTAAFLASQGIDDAWDETERRKPEKAADGRHARAKKLYATLRKIKTPEPLPNI